MKNRQQFEFSILGIKAMNKQQLIFSNKDNKFYRPEQPNDWYDIIAKKES